MADPASIETIRAAVEVILPGDGVLPSGADLDVQRHVAELADGYLEGFADMIAALLDAYAAERAGGPFKDLDPAERIAVLRAMASEEIQDLRDAADAVFVFSYGGMYSEWTGFDRQQRALRVPAAWARVGYDGPVLGHPDFRTGDPGPAPDVRQVEP
ncbi:MAG TPA: gluconate 2-dehydrogenase subunit 3 family protein [Actinomycetota bacterium]